MSDFEARGRDGCRGVVPAAMTLLLWGVPANRILAQELNGPDSAGSVSSRSSLPSILKSEAQRYVTDGRSILLAPFHWDGGSWTQAALALASVALLTREDSRIDTAFQRKRSAH